MKNMINKSIISLLLINTFASFSSIFAQDTRSSLPYADPINLNPAIAGANKDIRLLLNYRDQWSSLDKGFTTYSATVLYPLFIGSHSTLMTKTSDKGDATANNVASKLDFAIGAKNYKAGAFNTMNLNLSVGYNLCLADNNYLSTAIFGSYVQKSLDVTNLTFDEQYINGSYSASNPHSEPVLNEKINYPSVGFGLMWYNNEGGEGKLNSFMGISGFNLNKPNESFTGAKGVLPRRFSFQGGIKIIGKNKIDITPNVIYTVQSGAQLLSAGLYLDYRLNEKSKLVIGSWYKVNDAVTFLIGFDYNLFTIGYGYDVVTSDLTNSVSGLNTHSISLSLKLDQAKRKGLNLNNPFCSF